MYIAFAECNIVLSPLPKEQIYSLFTDYMSVPLMYCSTENILLHICFHIFHYRLIFSTHGVLILN